MAGGAVNVGALEITLDGNFAKIERAVGELAKKFTSAEREINTATKKSENSIGGFNIKLAAALATAKKLFTDLAESSKKTLDLSRSIDVAAGSLGKLNYAAIATGANADQLGSALQSLADKMRERGEFAEGPRIFEALGVRIRDAKGQFLATDAVLAAVADKFARMKDGVDKSRLAVQLLGASGVALLPMLDKGAAGIKALGEEGVRTGAALGGDTIEKMKRFTVETDKMWERAKVLAVEGLTPLLPILDQFIKKIEDGASGIVRFNEAAKTGGFSAAVDDWIKQSIKANTWLGTLAAAGLYLSNVQTGQVVPALIATSEQTRLLTGFSQAFKASQDAATASTTASTEALGTWATTIDKTVKPPIIATQEELQKAKQALENFNRYMLEDLMNGKMPYEDKLKQLEEMVRKGKISWREFAMAAKTASDEEKDAMLATAEMASQTLTTIFKNNKAAAIAAAVINTAVGITKAISQYPPPWSFAMAGMQAAMGAAQIASIKSTSENSSAGAVAAPSAAAPAAATEAASEAAAPAGTNSTLTVQGLNVGEMISGPVLREIMGRMVQAQKDGVQLVIGK